MPSGIYVCLLSIVTYTYDLIHSNPFTGGEGDGEKSAANSVAIYLSVIAGT